MGSNVSFNYESIQDPSTIRKFVTSVLDGIDSGRIVLASNGEQIELHPSSILKLEVKAKKKGTTGRVSIRVSWKENSPVNPPENEKLVVLSET